MPSTLNLLLNGAKGRMGQAICAAAQACHTAIVTKIDLGDDPSTHIAHCDVVIDFSFHTATLPLTTLAAAHGKPVVIGTTGHSDAERKALLEQAQNIPIVWSGNYATGVNLLFHLTAQAAHILGTNYHPEIIERHHRLKKDTPSGTAEQLAALVRQARNLTPEQTRHGRKGITGERPDKEIGVHAVRGGDIIGEHTVLFAGPGEYLELIHRASDRSIFAHGALRATHWVAQQKTPGHYTMADVLGLKSDRS